MPGFRPGKVPLNLVKKMHGTSLRGEAVQAVVNEGVQQLMSEHSLRPAMQPQVDLAGEDAEGQDLDFTVSVEVLPVIEAPNVEGLKLEKLVVEPTDADMDAALKRLSDQQKQFETAPAESEAADRRRRAHRLRRFGRRQAVRRRQGRGHAHRARLRPAHPRLRGPAGRCQGRRPAHVKVTFPDDYNVDDAEG